MATHSNISWTEEPGRLQSMVSQTIRRYCTQHHHPLLTNWQMILKGKAVMNAGLCPLHFILSGTRTSQAHNLDVSQVLSK